MRREGVFSGKNPREEDPHEENPHEENPQEGSPPKHSDEEPPTRNLFQALSEESDCPLGRRSGAQIADYIK